MKVKEQDELITKHFRKTRKSKSEHSVKSTTDDISLFNQTLNGFAYNEPINAVISKYK